MARLQSNKSTNGRTLSVAMAIASARFLHAVRPALAVQWASKRFLTPPRRRSIATEQTVVGEADAIDVEHHGLTLHGYRWGTGPTVLLVHGWGGDAAQLTPLVGPLLRAGRSVIAFDMPAHGKSQGLTTNAVDMGRAITAIVDNVGPVEGIVAHSVGATATTLALRAGLWVPRVAFIAPADQPGEWLAHFVEALGIGDLDAATVGRYVEEQVGVPFKELPISVHAPYMLSELLVIHDDNDRECSADRSAAIVKTWPGARLVRTTGLGHRRIVSDKAVVARAVAHISNGQTHDSEQVGFRDLHFADQIERIAANFEAIL
jgi:pimeloyl-ACP methyl ester carboxylesterase